MIHLENLCVSAGPFRLRDISLKIPTGKYGILMGRTGCGKTTVLEAICGLKKVTGGRIILSGTDVTRLRPGERGIGLVPQESALFHAMTVRENLAFGPTVQRWPRAEIGERAEAVAADLGISHLLDRTPGGLSGGERQRVALGRAICPRPHTLCLDEPLSALDEDTRTEIADILRHIAQSHQITVLHVTHSQWEAERLGDYRFRWSPEGRILPESSV